MYITLKIMLCQENIEIFLAGHSSYRYNEVFNEVHKISLQDEIIIIKTLNYEFTYIVKDVYKVEGFIGKDEDDIYFIPQKVC